MSIDISLFSIFLEDVPHELSFILIIDHIFAGKTIHTYTIAYKKYNRFSGSLLKIYPYIDLISPIDSNKVE
jgi:hypothetical protein